MPRFVNRREWSSALFCMSGRAADRTSAPALPANWGRGNYEYYECYEYCESGIYGLCTICAGCVSQRYARRPATGPAVMPSARGGLTFCKDLICDPATTANPAFALVLNCLDARPGNLLPAPNPAGAVFMVFIVFIDLRGLIFLLEQGFSQNAGRSPSRSKKSAVVSPSRRAAPHSLRIVTERS